MKKSVFTLILLCVGIVFWHCHQPSFKQGELLYEQHCSNCHMPDGSGLGKLIPPLAKADFLSQHPDQLACIVRNGLDREIVVNGIRYEEIMPANRGLSNAEIANILNYIGQAWGNKLQFVNLEAINKQLKDCTE